MAAELLKFWNWTVTPLEMVSDVLALFRWIRSPQTTVPVPLMLLPPPNPPMYRSPTDEPVMLPEVHWTFPVVMETPWLSILPPEPAAIVRVESIVSALATVRVDVQPLPMSRFAQSQVASTVQGVDTPPVKLVPNCAVPLLPASPGALFVQFLPSDQAVLTAPFHIVAT